MDDGAEYFFSSMHLQELNEPPDNWVTVVIRSMLIMKMKTISLLPSLVFFPR
jgi:hypothetical protein